MNCHFDADGNTLTGGNRTNTWDSQNRLVSCTYNGTTSTFKYGADGLCRQATVNGITTDYVYDGQTLIREGHASGGTLTAANVTVTYLQGPRGTECRIDETQQTEGYYNPADASPRPVHARGVTKWYVYDGLGSVVGEMDFNGNLTSSPKYDVYGGVRSNGGTASSKMGFVGGLGHLSEATTGLIYMRARYYDPGNGRFSSEDPSHNGNNWFVYCDNNPINYVDGTGKDKQSTKDWLEALKNICQVVAVILVAVLTIMLWPEAAALAMTAIGVVFGAAASLAWCAAVLTPAVGLSLLLAITLLSITAIACDQIMYDMDHEGESGSSNDGSDDRNNDPGGTGGISDYGY